MVYYKGVLRVIYVYGAIDTVLKIRLCPAYLRQSNYYNDDDDDDRSNMSIEDTREDDRDDIADIVRRNRTKQFRPVFLDWKLVRPGPSN